jgi:hypothetical protein
MCLLLPSISSAAGVVEARLLSPALEQVPRLALEQGPALPVPDWERGLLLAN